MRGTIRKRGTSWEWMHNAPPGYDRKYITGTRKTKREAAAALAASIADHDRRQAIEPTRQLAVDYLAAWLEVRRLAVKPSTWRSDADAVRLHLAPQLKGVKLTEVSGVHLARTYEAMRSKGLSEKTVLNVHTSAHAAFAAAIKARFLTRNPCDEVQRPKPQAVQMRTWSAVQLAAFLDYTADDRLHTLLANRLYHGHAAS